MNSILLGAITLILAEATFAGVGAMVKHLSVELTESQLIFFRNLFATLFLAPFLVNKSKASKSQSTTLASEHWKLHLFRGATGIAGMYCFFYVLAELPLTSAILALKTAPFFIPVISLLWLKEPATKYTWMAIAIGFVGVVLILDPWSHGAVVYQPFVLMIGLLCAVLVATTKCTLRKLGETEPTVRIVAWFTLISCAVSFPPMIIDWQPIEGTQWLFLVAIGGLAVAGQVLMTKAYKYAPPVQIGLLGYSSVVFAAILGWSIWNETVTGAMYIGFAVLLWAANMTIRQRWFW